MESENNLQLFIDGKWQPALSGETFAVTNPATQEIVGYASKAGQEESRMALLAAEKAGKIWSRTTPDDRYKLLKKAASEILANKEKLAMILTAEHGKPLRDARKEIQGAASTLEYYAEEARRISGEIAPSKSATSRSLVIRQPVGVVAAITPWNYPVSLMMWKLAPALAAGCTVVIKPPELAPLACGKTAAIVAQCGLPAGAVNVVTGPSRLVGEELISNPITQLVAFTGSTATGKHLMEVGSHTLKKLILELGGHTPLVVFKDADLKKAITDGVQRSYRNMGQICNAVNRIYVEKDIADEYVAEFIKQAKMMTIGDGLKNPDIDLGPMISQEGINRTQQHIDDALKKGAQLICGGRKPEGAEYTHGYYYEPSAVYPAARDMLVMQEETFGPLTGISVFSGLDEAIDLANSTDFGLVTYAYTQSLKTAFQFGELVESGSVAINSISPDSLYAPYPAWKNSGIGLELSHFGLEEYTQVKHLLLEIS